jgi:uncharacterized protein (DUF2236 family)
LVPDVPGITDRINGERVVLLGWPCAILMQVAHPLIAAGVLDHSTFRDNAVAPIRRLHSTVRAMLGLSFGTPAERAEVIATIRSIHTRVNGTLQTDVGRYAAGTRYSAEDPALLLWVHATLVDTSIRLFEMLAGKLTDQERDEYCRESASVAVALGADTDAVPRDWTTMKSYVQQVVGSDTLAVGPDARAVAEALLNSRVVRISGPLASVTRQLTAGLLPAELRRQYGLPWDARQELQFKRLLGRVAALREWTPQSVARWRSR